VKGGVEGNRNRSEVAEGGIYCVLLFRASRTINGRHKGGRRDELNSRIIDRETAGIERPTEFSISIKARISYIQLIKTASRSTVEHTSPRFAGDRSPSVADYQFDRSRKLIANPTGRTHKSTCKDMCL